MVVSSMVCIAGKNRIATGVLDYLIELGIEKERILVCVNDTDEGYNSWQPSLLSYCRLNGIKVVDLPDLYDIEDLFFFSLEFDKIIKNKKFKTKNIFNIHFSNLPKYKGMYTSIFPILNGDYKAGVTLHLIDEGIDTGDIIDQLFFEISDLTSFELYSKFVDYGLILFKSNFSNIIQREYNSKTQLAEGSTYNSKKSIDFGNLQLDINKTASEIEQQIRAFSFRPYQLLTFNNQKITHSKVLNFRTYGAPGNILKHNTNSVIIKTIDFAIELFFDRIDEILKACEFNETTKLASFIQQGYYMNDYGKNGWTPLIVSAYFNSYDAFNLLVNNSGDIHAVNFNGTSVLMYAMSSASISNKLEILKYLLDKGANPNHRDYKGHSVMDYALKLNNKSVIDLISNYTNVIPIS